MSYLTAKNDRIRRRKARVATFLITTALFAAGAYSMGILDELPTLIQQLLGTVEEGGAVA